MNTAAIIGLGLLQITGMNDIKPSDNGWLNLGPKDPYVWMTAPEIDQKVTGVLIDYQIENAPPEYGVEIYYSTNLHSFSENFKHYFKLKTKADDRLYIPLDLINMESLQNFRLDFDQCGGCRVKIERIKLIGDSELSEVTKYQPADYQSKIQQKKLITTPEGKWLGLGQPYIRKFLSESNPDSSAVLLKYQINDAPAIYRLNFYYSTNLHLFSEQLKYTFQRSEQSNNTLLVPIDLIQGESLQAIMLDLENCAGCRMQLTEVGLLDQGNITQYQQYVPADYQSQISIKQEVLSDKGMRIDLQDFTLKDLKTLGNNKVKVIGKEPRLDSPPLELNIGDFSGIYLRLKVPEIQKTGMYINLDWNTVRHGHRKKIVTRWWGEDKNTAELFIPFDPISAEQLLKYFWIRFEPQLADEYTVEEIIIVTKDKQQEFEDLSPSLANFPGAISSLPGLIKGGLKRMATDWAFLFIYSLSIISLVAVLILRFISKSKRTTKL